MSACDFGAGWFGGVAGISMGHPMDTIKVRVQAAKGTELTALQAFRKCLQTEGVATKGAKKEKTNNKFLFFHSTEASSRDFPTRSWPRAQ